MENVPPTHNAGDAAETDSVRAKRCKGLSRRQPGAAGATEQVDFNFDNLATATLNAPETKTRFASLLAEPVPSTPEAFGAFMKSELAKYEKVVKASGTTVD